MRKRSMYPNYFAMSIHQRINARQYRNALNINGLFSTTISSRYGQNHDCVTYPKINNGLYHRVGKNHSQYKTLVNRINEGIIFHTAIN